MFRTVPALFANWFDTFGADDHPRVFFGLGTSQEGFTCWTNLAVSIISMQGIYLSLLIIASKLENPGNDAFCMFGLGILFAVVAFEGH